MTNRVEFEYAMRKQGLSRKDVADYLEMSYTALCNRILNKSEFQASELAKLFKLFKLETAEEQKRIFFALDVEQSEQKKHDGGQNA